MDLTTQEIELLSRSKAVISLLSQGRIIEAMTEYLADDVQLQEAGFPPKIGKAFCIAEQQKLLDNVTEFIGYTLVNGPTVKGDITMYESILEFKTNDGIQHRFEQAIRTKWKNNKIINERFYHI